jgi:hypothetical protein
MANLMRNLENAFKDGGGEYLTKMTGSMVMEAKKSSPYWTGEVRESIGGQVVRDDDMGTILVVEATAPHARFTEDWPSPHPVSIRNPRIARWVREHDVSPHGEYLEVYGYSPLALSLRTPQHWFRDSINRVIERYGKKKLVEEVTGGIVRVKNWNRVVGAKKGWLKRDPFSYKRSVNAMAYGMAGGFD